MRVLVCGGRNFDNWKSVHRELVGIGPTVIIQGGARGADALAAKWADHNGVPLVTYPALWSRGRKAGPERNAFMLNDSRPDLLVAFPGGHGTSDMVSRAIKAGVRVIQISGGGSSVV